MGKGTYKMEIPKPKSQIPNSKTQTCLPQAGSKTQTCLRQAGSKTQIPKGFSPEIYRLFGICSL